MAFFKEIVDLGHELYNGMPNLGANIVAFWPTETFNSTRTMSDGKLAFESRMILMSEHCGTHFDAPYHYCEKGLKVDEIPLDKLVLPGQLFNFTSKRPHEPILPEDFESAGKKIGKEIQEGKAIIVWTGQDKKWAQEGFITERPYIPVETAEWLIKRNVTLLGSDLIGFDDPDDKWWRTHKVLLEGGLPFVQQLCNLEMLEGKEFLFVVLPLKMQGGTASPVRPVALII